MVICKMAGFSEVSQEKKKKKRVPAVRFDKRPKVVGTPACFGKPLKIKMKEIK